MSKPTVLIRHCSDYDVDQIAKVLGEGMETLGVRPHGHTMVKPNVVAAARGHYEQAYTRAEFLDGLLAATRAHGKAITQLSVGERSALTLPTRFTFHQARYRPVLRRHHAKAYYFEEYPDVEIPLHDPAALRPYVYVPVPVTQCDFLINAPKLKAHVWTRMTCALKNYVGLQDSSHRIIDHDFHLEHKIVDLQEIITPGFIAVDAITAGELTMMSPVPRALGLIIMGLNPVAVDVVCAHILGIDPRTMDYIRMAATRGLGPLDLADITLGGDVSLEAAQKRAANFGFAIEKVDTALARRTDRITVHLGPAPVDEEAGDGYCWGGCPGALLETLESLQRAWQPDVYETIRPMTFVFGAYRGPITPKPGEPVIFFGDCAQWHGELGGQEIDIKSAYVSHRRVDPRHDTKHVDITRIILRYFWNIIWRRRRPYHRIYGCPASMHEDHLVLAFLGGARNPYTDLRLFVAFVPLYIVSVLVRWRRLGWAAVTARLRPGRTKPASEKPGAHGNHDAA